MSHRAVAVSGVQFVPAAPAVVPTGLVGWLSFTLPDGLRIKGATLRRTRDGRLRLSFPERIDSHGRRHACIHPVTTAAREAIEAAVLEALGLDGAAMTGSEAQGEAGP